MLLIEFGLAAIAVVAAFAFPNAGSRFFEAVERAFARLARRRTLAVAAVGLAALGVRGVLLPLLPIPVPAVQDEFSHLLAADTFAHRRFTNPTHPMWIHFETFHVIWHPTYASMYPPAQGLILALGQVFFGHPFWGLWLSLGLMCAAICWMLQGWLPPGWALVGGLLTVIRLCVFSYWANTYFGGALPAAGGALVLGALPRIKRSQRPRDALLMGLGLAILANSRPYEGLIFSLPVAAALLMWVAGKGRPPLWVALRRVALPLGLLLAVTAAAIGYYNRRVTGSPLLLPQQLNRETYAIAPYFLWGTPRAQPAYHHAVMRDFYTGWELQGYQQETSSLSVLVVSVLAKFLACWLFFIGPALTLLLLAALAAAPQGLKWASLSSNTRFLLIALGVASAALAVEVFFSAHYAAPMTGLIFALLLVPVRGLRRWRWKGKPSGLFMTRAVPLACLLALLAQIAASTFHLPPAGKSTQACWFGSADFHGSLDRARMEAQLRREPKRQLVIVRYSPSHDPGAEWVYNNADIDGSKVVWARDMGPANEELLRYYKDREVWLVEPDETPPRLSTYSSALMAGAGARPSDGDF